MSFLLYLDGQDAGSLLVHNLIHSFDTFLCHIIYLISHSKRIILGYSLHMTIFSFLHKILSCPSYSTNSLTVVLCDFVQLLDNGLQGSTFMNPWSHEFHFDFLFHVNYKKDSLFTLRVSILTLGIGTIKVP
jgi:hypothetical protein